MKLLEASAFRNLLVGLMISQLGDVCFVVALPWLVLQMTDSSAALGSILMTVAVPRAGLMLLGGAVTDRIPAKTILIVGNSVLTLTIAAVAMLVAHHVLTVWMLYVLAIVFGTTDAFAMPAAKALLPSVVAREQITAANSMLQSATQVCLLAGGAIAGILIQRFGVVAAIAFDAGSFLFLIAALASIVTAASGRVHTSSLIASIRDGVAYAMREPSTRTLLLVIAAVNFCVVGATQVGLAVLVHSRFGSAAYYGSLVTTVAIGSLAGIGLAGVLRVRGDLSAALLTAGALLGGCIASLALPLPIAAIFALLLFCGVIAGSINVHVVSALQGNVPPEVLGRVMSIVMLSSVGLMPVSLALSGILAQISLELLFTSAGCGLLAVAAVGFALIWRERVSDSGTPSETIEEAPLSSVR